MYNKIVFATGNSGKLNEIKMIMADLDAEILSIKEAGINVTIVEDGATFEENAIIKARTVMAECGVLTLADDSGLAVDYLGGEPGVYSARYMGEDTPYSVKNQSIIDRLAGAEGRDRSARFVCVIAAAVPGGAVFTTEGTIEGLIGYEERGANGFGYDPIMYIPEYAATTAELAPEVKNNISHRGKALRAMKAELISRGLVRLKQQ